MCCYLIARIVIRNRELYKQYEAGFDEVFARYKGEVVVDDHPAPLEGSPRGRR